MHIYEDSEAPLGHTSKNIRVFEGPHAHYMHIYEENEAPLGQTSKKHVLLRAPTHTICIFTRRTRPH